MKIAISGIGYVGLANAVLLAQHNHVTAVDLVQEKVDKINNRISPLADPELEDYLAHHTLDLTATTDGAAAYRDAEYVIISTPTNYDSEKNHFDTSSVESVIELVMSVNPNAILVIKSTVPVGYTLSVREKYHNDNIIFSPEFLREGKALYDNLYPSRIIVGAPLDIPRLKAASEMFAGLLQQGALKKDVPVLITSPTEAEAVKLFANTYLAMRVSFLMNWILMPKYVAWIPAKSLKAFVWIRVSVISIITPVSATVAIACQRTPSNFWPTTIKSPIILLEPS